VPAPGRRARLLGRRNGPERRVLFEDGVLEPLECLARLEPELFRQPAPRLLVDVESLCLPAGAVESEHELAAESFSQRVLPDERLQLGDEVRLPTERQVGFDSLLEHLQVEFLQPPALGLHQGARVDVGERLSAPEGKRLREPCGRRLGMAARELFLPLAQQSFETADVDRRGLGVQHVPGCARDDQLGSEHLAQARNVALKCRDGGLGRPLAPDGLDQLVTGDDTVCVEEQCRKHGALLWPANGEQSTIALDLERPEDPKLHENA